MVFGIGAGEGEHRKVVADAQMAQCLIATRAEAVPADLANWSQVDIKARLQPRLLGENVDELLGSDQVRPRGDLPVSAGVVDRHTSAPS